MKNRAEMPILRLLEWKQLRINAGGSPDGYPTRPSTSYEKSLKTLISNYSSGETPQWDSFKIIKGRVPTRLAPNMHLATWYEKVWSFCKSLLTPFKRYNARRRAIKCLTHQK